MMRDYINNEKVDGHVTRRTAKYKPNIWNYDHLLSLATKFNEENQNREAKSLKHEISGILGALENPLLYKLELICAMDKLALSHYFEDEINEAVSRIACVGSSTNFIMNEGPYTIALCFRILRQYGHHVSLDTLLCLINSTQLDAKATAEIFEASHLASLEEEFLLERVKAVRDFNLEDGDGIDDANKNKYSARCPLHWSVVWFNVKKHMDTSTNSTLLRLARLSFNMIQHQHQKDLKEILRWWKNLGLSEVLTFTRDRAVESFLWAVGVAYEPQHGSLRKWLTKAIMLILIIDDVYDIYGSMEELEQFTSAVEMWDPTEIEQLPKTMKRCFLALYDTANDISLEIQKEKGWKSVLTHLKKVWIGFCKSLFVEAKWYHTGHSPILSEYLDNGWISSSGPLLSLHILLGVCKDMKEFFGVLNNSQEIIYHSSLIIRLSNDQGTAKAEVERGDAPSSILCYMREENATEEEARDHVRNITTNSWKKINGLFLGTPRSHQPMVRYIINAARVANFIYQKGDGFGVQDRGTRDQVLSCLIDPLPLV